MLQLMDLTLLLDCWEDVPALFFMFEIGSQLKPPRFGFDLSIFQIS